MTSNLTPDQEYELVYQGICAVAANCDGAVTRDFVGFDGQDTHYGRRVASVAFDAWTPEVRSECARIANKYQKQILAYTGTDVTTLQVVRDALDQGTNYAARNHARGYEKRAKHLAARTIDVVAGGKLGIRWASGDPSFDLFLGKVRSLPGRYWNGAAKVNEVNPSPEVRVFIDEYDFTLSPAAEALLGNAPAPVPAAAPLAQVRLEDANHVVITAGYDEAMLAPLRALPGRYFDRDRKVNIADTHPAVLRLAEKFRLSVSPEARAACEAGQAEREQAAMSAGDLNAVIAHVSRAKDPTTLPPIFEDMLAPILARYGAEEALS